MNKNDSLSRLSIDIPNDLQKKLKTLAALHDTSMRKVVITALEKEVHELEKCSTDVLFNFASK